MLSNLICRSWVKVRKSDVTKYSREKIKLEELKKRAKIRRG